MPEPPIRIGTRGSALALAQTTLVKELLEKAHPRLRFELKIVRTRGDDLSAADHYTIDPVFGVTPAEIPAPRKPPPPAAPGLFTKELEKALLRNHIDLAVHSLKDLPVRITPGLVLAAIPKRASPLDLLVTRDGATLETLPDGATLATGSPRRRAEIARARPGARFADIRGNIDTRLRKLEATPAWHGIVLAAAGIERLRPDTTGLALVPIPANAVLPAPGQAALALETREADGRVRAIAGVLDHFATRCAVDTERAFLEGLGGGCQLPLGAHAVAREGAVAFHARFHLPGGCHEIQQRWPAADAPHQARTLAHGIPKPPSK